MSFRIIWRKFATIANLATNQELTLEGTASFSLAPSPLPAGVGGYIYIYIFNIQRKREFLQKHDAPSVYIYI